MSKTNSNLLDKVCQLGQTCYCNPSFGQKLSQIFMITTIIILIITIVVYLIFLNRHKIALFMAPKLYYNCHQKLPEIRNNNNNNNN